MRTAIEAGNEGMAEIERESIGEAWPASWPKLWNGPVWQLFDPRDGYRTTFVEMVCHCVPRGRRYEVRESIQRRDALFVVCTTCGGHRNPDLFHLAQTLGWTPATTNLESR
jgi:hypothetical protein